MVRLDDKQLYLHFQQLRFSTGDESYNISHEEITHILEQNGSSYFLVDWNHDGRVGQGDFKVSPIHNSTGFKFETLGDESDLSSSPSRLMWQGALDSLEAKVRPIAERDAYLVKKFGLVGGTALHMGIALAETVVSIKDIPAAASNAVLNLEEGLAKFNADQEEFFSDPHLSDEDRVSLEKRRGALMLDALGTGLVVGSTLGAGRRLIPEASPVPVKIPARPLQRPARPLDIHEAPIRAVAPPKKAMPKRSISKPAPHTQPPPVRENHHRLWDDTGVSSRAPTSGEVTRRARSRARPEAAPARRRPAQRPQTTGLLHPQRSQKAWEMQARERRNRRGQ